MKTLEQYGFQRTSDGKLFIPFALTRPGSQIEPAMIREGGEEPAANPNAGKYALSTDLGGEQGVLTQYFDSFSDYFDAYNTTAPFNNGVPLIDISNIQFEDAGTNNPSYFVYAPPGPNYQAPADIAGKYNGELGYFLDPSLLSFQESRPGPSAWVSFRDGPLPVALAAIGGWIFGPSGAAATTTDEGATVATTTVASDSDAVTAAITQSVEQTEQIYPSAALTGDEATTAFGGGGFGVSDVLSGINKALPIVRGFFGKSGVPDAPETQSMQQAPALPQSQAFASNPLQYGVPSQQTSAPDETWLMIAVAIIAVVMLLLFTPKGR